MLGFPTSQEMDLNDFDFPLCREEGAGTHLPPTGRFANMKHIQVYTVCSSFVQDNALLVQSN